MHGLHFYGSVVPLVLLGGIILVHVIPWLWDRYHQRHIPGPFIAKFSDVWVAYWASKGKRSEAVHRAHLEYGPIIRIAPNHVSIALPDALQAVYGHSTRTLKSDFYDAFVSITRGLFNTRSRAEHSRKRKIVSAIFSPNNVRQFETNIHLCLKAFVKQWDRIAASAMYYEDKSPRAHLKNENNSWKGDGERIWFDCLPWFNYLAFDIIGDLAFGSPFGMIEAGRDAAPMVLQTDSSEHGDGLVVDVPAVEVLNRRGEFSALLGLFRPWLRPHLKRLPYFASGNQAVQNLAGIAIAAVSKRLAAGNSHLTSEGRTDLLEKLQAGKDENGNPMGQLELTAEALTQLIAGSDTTSNSSCAIIYYLAKHPHALRTLQRELDDELGRGTTLPLHDQIRNLPYLNAAINESLRLHSTSSLGLPRLVPPGGLAVCGVVYSTGTVLSVPSYSVHRDQGVWGVDAETFRPERWLEGDQTMIQKTFNPFSYGPRACVGRNLAQMELLLIVSTIVHRYDLILRNPTKNVSGVSFCFLRLETLIRVFWTLILAARDKRRLSSKAVALLSKNQTQDEKCKGGMKRAVFGGG